MRRPSEPCVLAAQLQQNAQGSFLVHVAAAGAPLSSAYLFSFTGPPMDFAQPYFYHNYETARSTPRARRYCLPSQIDKSMANSARTTGALPPPPGVQPNFVDPENHTKSTIALHTICLTLATLFVVIRIYTRQFINGKLGLDDCKYFSQGKDHVLKLTMTKPLSVFLGRVELMIF